jgi:hypothetical protein
MDESVLSVIKNSFENILSDDIEDFVAATESMSTQFISLKETKVSSRKFIHWKDEGLIDYSLNEKRVKLTLFEYIWVKTISVMRSFGVSISSIRQIKEELNTDVYRYLIKLKEEKTEIDFEKIIGHFTKDKSQKEQILFVMSNYDKKSDDEMLPFANTLFNYSIMNCLVSRERVDIIVFDNGETFLLLESTYGFLKETHGEEAVLGLEKILSAPNLRINLNYLINEFLNEKERADYIVNEHIFSSSEMLAIKLLRNKNNFKIDITKENKGEVIRFDVTQKSKKIEGEDLNIIQEIIGLGKYQSINLRMDGNKMYMKRKITTKKNS